MQTVKRCFVFIMVFLICCQVSCYPQQASKDKDTYHHDFMPCFISEAPKVINLPDSFEFKEKNYFAFFHVTFCFDSLGNVLETIPQQLYIKNKASEKLEKKYSYWRGWEDSAINMTKEEAMQYANWAQKGLPPVIKLKRYPPNIKCNEKITNRIERLLEFRLE